MFELANVRIIESCHKNSSRPSEWKKNTRKCLFGFLLSLNEDMVHFYRVFSRMRQIACLFLHVDFVIHCYSHFKSMSELVCWLTKQKISNIYFKMSVRQ